MQELESSFAADEERYRKAIESHLSSNDYRKYEYTYEHLLVYYTFRYFPRATYDYNLAEKARFAVFCCRVIRDLDALRYEERGRFTFADRIETVKDFSKQVEHLSNEEIRALADATMEDFPARCRRFAPKVGMNYGRITIRSQKTRWSSCSSKENLNFNCLLMLAPPEVRDYVVVHELCHRLEMNHSVRFWAEVERVLPDYKVRLVWLKEHGPEIMMRMVR